jgi:DNA-binding response OmpR family regulator
MRILLVEDDAKLGFMLHYKLNKERNTVDWAKNADDAEGFFETGAYDMYIFDWMMPGKNGVQLCKERRAKNDNTAILMLTARDEVGHRVEGLMSGADDYVIKPFEFEELIARIHALDRRVQLKGYKDIYVVDNLALNPQTYEVTREGNEIRLTRREFQLLNYLMRHAGKVISREQILNQVWGSDAEVTLNAIDATVKLLRKKVDDPYDAKLIQSVHGFGYKLLASEDINNV